MIKLDSELFESKLESYIQEAYKDHEYLRCYNLAKHLLKYDKSNRVWLYYMSKLTPKLLEKEKRRWVWCKPIFFYILHPKILFVLIGLNLFGK